MKVSNNNDGRGLGICDRCACQYPLQALRPDGDSPGLIVCQECWDPIDPYRLPARQTEDYIIKNPRPPQPLVVPGTYYVAQSNTQGNIIQSDAGIVTDPFGPEPQ